MRLSSATRNTPNGKIVNMIQVDAPKIQSFTLKMGRLPMLPFVFFGCMIVLFQELGASLLSGLGAFIFLVLFNLFVNKKIKSLSKESRKRDDDRFNCTTECLNNIKTLKFYQWTKSFEQEIIKRK